MKITILNENVTYKRGLLCEHGLSLLIEQGENGGCLTPGRRRCLSGMRSG